jgi:N-acyl-D-amino-acid deacylase
MNTRVDTLIRGGTVLDGTGGDPFEADVAVHGGIITALGRRLPLRASEEIDARGMLVTPGFIDIHTHYDAQVTWESSLTPSSGHGVTTVVMGNCAIGVAPCKPEHHDLLVRVIAGVEDIPEAVMVAGLRWDWETYPQYLDVLAGRRSDIDFASQIAHSAIRVYVMGQRGADREPARGADLAAMTRLVTEAIQAGALGVSTSRTIAHRTIEGALAPAETSSEDELLALARGLKQANGGVFELITDFPDLEVGGTSHFDLLRRIVRESGNRTLSFTIVQNPNETGGWRRLLDLTTQANIDGLPIKGQVAPRAVGMLFGHDLSFNPFSFRPSYRAIAHLPLQERIAQLRKPEIRATILSETSTNASPLMLWLVGLCGQMFVLNDPPNYEPAPEERIDARAQRAGSTVPELVYDLLLEQEGRQMLLLPITNYLEGSLEDALTMMRHPHTVIGLGDGGAHCGLICDASHPTFLLTHWVRDRTRGERVPLAWAIRKLTSELAATVGLNDRGRVRPGYKADLNVIDFDRLRMFAPQVAYDLPAGGRRLTQRAEGYVATMVSGQVTYREGKPTGLLPGRLVRGAQRAPVAGALTAQQFLQWNES